MTGVKNDSHGELVRVVVSESCLDNVWVSFKVESDGIGENWGEELRDAVGMSSERYARGGLCECRKGEGN